MEMTIINYIYMISPIMIPLLEISSEYLVLLFLLFFFFNVCICEP